MLRGLAKPLVLTLFVVWVFGFGIAIGWSSRSPRNEHPKAQTTQQSVDTDKGVKHPAFGDWITQDPAGFFTFWLVIVGFGQAGLFFWQLLLIGESLADAKAAAEAATIGAKAAELTARANIAQMRAYIDVYDAKIYGFDQEGDSRVVIRFVNSGGTVAFEVVGESGVAIGEAEISRFKGDLRPENYTLDHMSKAALARNGMFGGSNIIPTIHLSPEIKAAIRSGSQAIFAYGKITYKDSLRNPHTTTYRLMFGGPPGAHPEGHFVICEEGNDSD